MKLNLVLTEYFTTTSWRKLEIDTNDFPLLKGMTDKITGEGEDLTFE